jgi:hypothetical protein
MISDSRLREDRIDISRAVEHADDLDAVFHLSIEDHVNADGKAPQSGRELLPYATHAWHFGKLATSLFDPVNPPGGSGRVVRRNVIVDLFQIA